MLRALISRDDSAKGGALPEQNADRLSKVMKPAGAQDYEPGDIVALSFNSPDEEARYIADTIKVLRGVAVRQDDAERGISWSDMAVLLRSVKRNGVLGTYQH